MTAWNQNLAARARLAEVAARGLSLVEMAAELGVAKSCVHAWLRRDGIRRVAAVAGPRRRWSAAEVAALRRLEAEGASLDGMASALRRDREGVRRKLDFLTVARRRSTMRRCLGCRTEFPSVGPGNRMCDPCRARGDDGLGGQWIGAAA